MVSYWVGVRQSVLVSVLLANLVVIDLNQLNFSAQWVARKADD